LDLVGGGRVLVAAEHAVELRRAGGAPRHRRENQRSDHQHAHHFTFGSSRMTWPCCTERCCPELSSQYIKLVCPSTAVSVSGSVLPSCSCEWNSPTEWPSSWPIVVPSSAEEPPRLAHIDSIDTTTPECGVPSTGDAGMPPAMPRMFDAAPF